MSLRCESDGNCPYIFSCIAGICVHDPVFPLTVYSSFCYILLVFGVMLSNVGGLSAGVFKVPILMDMLNYPVNVATQMSYPIVTGASLANFIQLCSQHHPPQPKAAPHEANFVRGFQYCVALDTMCKLRLNSRLHCREVHTPTLPRHHPFRIVHIADDFFLPASEKL